MKKIQTSIALLALFILFLASVILNNLYLGQYRLDLTQNHVYSLSDGSKQILKKIDEPIQLYYFFSDDTSKGMTPIRNYADRVKSLLEEYVLLSGGQLQLTIVDPEPFSEAEDKATEFGLTGAPVGSLGEKLYFGLAARNAFDQEETIAFFDPSKEEFLEYDISKLLQKLINPDTLKVTIVTDLPIAGGSTNIMNPMMGMPQQQAPWVFYQQLEQLYQVNLISTDQLLSIPDDTNVLMLITPNQLSQDQQYQIDQYIMNGGNALIFVDPYVESSLNPMQSENSNLVELLSQWGIEFDPAKIILDAENALEIRLPTGESGKHFGYLGLTQANINRHDAISGQLDSINGASFGALTKKIYQNFNFEPILTSSKHAEATDVNFYQTAQDPKLLQIDFKPSGNTHVLAARISGKLKSAFKDDTEFNQAADFTASANRANLIVVADADLLADRFWVQTSQFFGQMIATPFANNGDFIANATENLGGSNELISIRARGKFSRPFTVVKALEVEAEEKFRAKEQQLQSRLTETENQLTQLQGQQAETGKLVLTQEQEATINQFIQEKVKIRKALREVRHQLGKDIDQLGNWLKFINIALAPILLTFVLFLLSLIFRRRKLS